MRVAVTGATGFIGGHLTARLQEENGNEIIALGRDKERWNGIGEFVPFDLIDASPKAYDKLGNIDLLIHLAWGGLPNYESSRHYEIELPRQYEFLKTAMEGGLSRLLVLGTCYEYGMQSGALRESAPSSPKNPYGFAKDRLRRQLEFVASRTGVRLIWSRLFYVWGEGQSQSSLYSQLRTAIAESKASFDMSGGEQIRDFLPVEQAVDYIARLALSDRAEGIFNICSGQPVSVKRLVERWIRENGWKIQPNLGYYPYPTHEPMAFWGNRSRLDRFLNDMKEKECFVTE